MEQEEERKWNTFESVVILLLLVILLMAAAAMRWGRFTNLVCISPLKVSELSSIFDEGAYDKLFLCWEKIDDSKKQPTMEMELVRMNVLVTEANAGNIWAQFSNLKRAGYAVGCILPVKSAFRDRLYELVPVAEREKKKEMAARAKAQFPELIPKKVVSSASAQGGTEAMAPLLGAPDESLSLLRAEFRDFKRTSESILEQLMNGYKKMAKVVDGLVDLQRDEDSSMHSGGIEEIEDSMEGRVPSTPNAEEPPAWIPKKRSREEEEAPVDVEAKEPPQKKKRGNAK